MKIRRLWLGAVALTEALLAQGLPVPYERLVNADKEPGNWLMYSGGYRSWRYSPLDQINISNVKNLRAKWIFQGRSPEKFETTPLVVDGIMYLTRPENDVFALDAATGRVMWTYSHKNPTSTYNCCGRVNRGLAILGHRLYMNTLDMHLVAIDARSGRELWKTKTHDYTLDGGYAATGAPLIVKDKVIVGMAGGEHPGRGFLDAYDAVTGKQAWRFHTIPEPGEPNFGTWAGDSWKTGGAATWNNGSYDVESNTLFWGTSNPWPDYNADDRKGANLYSCSVLALDPDSGKLKWYFQFTPQDTHDWDATQIPILIDRAGSDPAGAGKLMAWPSRNGFYYLLDRNNGKFILAKSFVRQTWAKGFDDNGKPEVIPGNDPTAEGIDTVFPGVDGGANWMSNSYSPLTRMLYVFARDERRVYTKNAVRHLTDGEPRVLNTAPRPGVVQAPNRPQGTGVFGAGGNLPAAAGRNPRAARFAPEESWGKVMAIDPLSGETKWEHKVISPPWGGVMSTAGNLVFGGTVEGLVFALDARTGEWLWHFAGNDRVYASPISFLANGKQHVSLAVGGVLMTFALD